MEKTGFLEAIHITPHTSGYTVSVSHVAETDKPDNYESGAFQCVTLSESYACNTAADVFDILKQYLLLDHKAQQEYFVDCPQFGE